MDIDPLPTMPLTGLVTLSARLIEFEAPPSWGTWILIIVIACLCLACSAFVSGSEIAYFGLTPSDIDDLREDTENLAAKRAFRLIKDSERLLATILIANNLVNISVVILLTFAINKTVIFHEGWLSFVVQSVVLTMLLLLVGEIVPKLAAKSFRLRWVKAASGFMTAIYHLFKPLAIFMVSSSSLVNKMVTKKASNLSADQLEAALEISNVKDGKDKELLEGILSFGDKQVSDIMTSRIDVTAINYDSKWSEAIDTILESGYSRIPVYQPEDDVIHGILYSKDLLPYLGRADDTFDWHKLIREPYFVPEARMIDDLLEDFRVRKIHIAIVIDEYGGTKGIVTLEDILEEIVGEIDDEYDEDADLYRKISKDTYIFDAKIPLLDFCRIVDIDEEELGEPGEEAESLAGLLLEIKGDFPEVKEVFKLGNLCFQVLAMERHRISKVKVKLLPPVDAKPAEMKDNDE